MLDFLNEANWWCLLLLLLLAFLLGWFLSRWSLKNKYQEKLDQCNKEKERLRNADYKKANTTFSQPIPLEIEDTGKELGTTDIETKITPVLDLKTETESTDNSVTTDDDEKPKLNFASFGKAEASEKDDLKRISGVGPFIEKKLNSIGIYTFDQISKFTKEDIDTVTDLIQFFPGRIERDNWTDQAEKFKNE